MGALAWLRLQPSEAGGWALLHFVQLLVNQQRQKSQKKDPRADAEHAHGQSEPADFSQQFGLLFLHVRIRVVEKKLIVLAHGESALVDEQHDQTDGEKSEDAADDFNWSHKPPQQSQPQAVVSLAGPVAQKVHTGPGGRP